MTKRLLALFALTVLLSLVGGGIPLAHASHITGVTATFDQATRKPTIKWTTPTSGTVTLSRLDSTGASGSTSQNASLKTYTFNAVSSAATWVDLSIAQSGEKVTVRVNTGTTPPPPTGCDGLAKVINASQATFTVNGWQEGCNNGNVTLAPGESTAATFDAEFIYTPVACIGLVVEKRTNGVLTSTSTLTYANSRGDGYHALDDQSEYTVTEHVDSCSPPPPPADNRGPAGSTILWSDNFESGLNCNVWKYVGNNDYAGGCSGAPSTMTRLSFPTDEGDKAARFEVRAADVASGGERSEIDTGSAAASNIFHSGDTRYLQGRIKLPSDFVSGAGFMIFTQFHSGIGSPPLSLSLTDGGGLQVGGNCDQVIVPDAAMNAAKGGYVDFSLKVDFSTNASVGGVDAWAETPNGIIHDPARKACATLADADSYLKIGQYRNTVYDHTTVIYMDDIVLSQ